MKLSVEDLRSELECLRLNGRFSSVAKAILVASYLQGATVQTCEAFIASKGDEIEGLLASEPRRLAKDELAILVEYLIGYRDGREVNDIDLAIVLFDFNCDDSRKSRLILGGEDELFNTRMPVDMIVNCCIDESGRYGKAPRRKYLITYEPAAGPILEARTKFGGQPNWVQQPAWPIDPVRNQKIRFVAQIRTDETIFPGNGGKMVYIFIDDSPTGDYDPICEVVVQSGSDVIEDAEPGPTLQDWDAVESEFEVHCTLAEDTPGRYEEYWDASTGHQIGGLPFFGFKEDVLYYFGSEEHFETMQLLLMLSIYDEVPYMLPGYGPTYWLFMNEDFTQHKLCFANL